MNKVVFPISLIALLLSIFCIYKLLTTTTNYAYVDVTKLVDGYKRTKLEKTKFQEKAKNLQSNVDSLIVNWKDELKAYEKNRSSMSKKENELKQQLLGNQQQQIGSYQQVVQKQIQEEDQKATQTVINDINDYIKEYGEDHSYDIIFGASGSGSIMYGAETVDLTDKVLEGLNKEFQGQ